MTLFLYMSKGNFLIKERKNVVTKIGNFLDRDTVRSGMRAKFDAAKKEVLAEFPRPGQVQFKTLKPKQSIGSSILQKIVNVLKMLKR